MPKSRAKSMNSVIIESGLSTLGPVWSAKYAEAF